LQRGWTQSAIENFLGEPDDTAVNPHYRSGPRIQLFAQPRVEVAENSLRFQKWAGKAEKRRQAARQAAEKAQVLVKTEVKKVENAWEQLKPLKNWQNQTFYKFDWEDFGLAERGDKFAQKEEAVKAARKMLKKSYWIPLRLFFEGFAQWGQDSINSKEHASSIAESIAKEGWNGIPLVSFFLEDKLGRVQLESGHHRWLALKQLHESGQIDGEFCVPIFNLKFAPSCFQEQAKEDAQQALDYLDAGLYSFAMKMYSRENVLLGLCSGIDN